MESITFFSTSDLPAQGLSNQFLSGQVFAQGFSAEASGLPTEFGLRVANPGVRAELDLRLLCNGELLATSSFSGAPQSGDGFVVFSLPLPAKPIRAGDDVVFELSSRAETYLEALPLVAEPTSLRAGSLPTLAPFNSRFYLRGAPIPEVPATPPPAPKLPAQASPGIWKRFRDWLLD